MKERYFTTFAKMTFSFLLFGVIPLLLLSVLFFVRYGGILRDNMTANYSAMTSYVSKNVGMIIENADEAMSEVYDYQTPASVSLTEVLKDSTQTDSVRTTTIKEALQTVLAKSEYISSVRMVDYRGNMYSLYVSQDKAMRADSDSHTMMDIYTEDDTLTSMKLLGTIDESDITVNSEDYVFSLVRNYMDTSTVQSTYTTALATIFADINVDEIGNVIGQSGLTAGDFYVYNTDSAQYLYSRNQNDYLDGSNPLAFCLEKLEGDSGVQKIDHRWVFYEKINDMDLYAVMVLNNSDIMGAMTQSKLALFLVLCFACACLLVLYSAFSIYMSAPTRKLKQAMEEVENGNFDVKVELNTHDEMEYVANGFNNMTEKLKDYINQMYVSEICRKDAELTALKMQIQPHYLYNTLDVIRMVALDQDDEKTAELLESLAHQLRYVMGPQSDRTYLKDELDAIREYFVITKARYEGRISLMIYAADEDLMLVIPKLLLQPVVENAIRHGLREKKGNGAVAIRVSRKSTYLEIIVMDDGVGMDEEQVRRMREILETPEVGLVDAEGRVSVGMKNVYDRIKLNCGMEYGFTIQSTLGMGTIVTYRLPIWEEL